MPLQSTSGAASYDAFGGGAAAKVNYIEDFFQSYLRTGTGASATVTTGLDGSTKETLVWTKSRSAATNHKLTDNVRGVTKALSSNTTGAEATDSQGLTAFSATGYTIGTNTDYNNSGATYVDWQWVAQPKFFDIVTYTGNGTSGRTVAHSLGSVPGCIIVKRTSGDPIDWLVYHRGVDATSPQNYDLKLNTTAARVLQSGSWNDTAPTSTVFTLGDSGTGNTNGETYVAYLFAHDAGGFGLTGTDNVISCGSFTTDGSGNATVNLGYEPQWLLAKRVDTTGNWELRDSMRPWPIDDIVNGQAQLFPNLSNAESNSGLMRSPTATGFAVSSHSASATYIYIAIRRGPMKVPTSGTSVFAPVARTGTGTATSISGVGFVPDFFLSQNRNVPGDPGPASSLSIVLSRLTNLKFLRTQTTSAEGDSTEVTSWNQSGVSLSADTFGRVNDTSVNTINYFIGRAPSFFDEVCYTGTGTAGQTYTHNLGVVPELMIVKGRSIAEEWNVYFGNNTNYLKLNRNDVPQTATTRWNDTSPTSSVFSVGTSNWVNASGSTYVAYLFASLAGVSKVFSYTGNGSSQTINCGFTGGSRFVLIKRTDAIGNWYVWDSARGIVAGNDPHLSLNSTAAEVTTDDSVDTDNTGFIVNQVAATNVNVSSATYIGIAIA